MATPDRQQDLPRSPGESAFRTWPDGPSPSEAASGFLFGAPAADSAGEEVGHGLVFRSGIWARATQRLWKNRRGPRRPTAGSARRRQPRLRPPLRGRHRRRLSLHPPARTLSDPAASGPGGRLRVPFAGNFGNLFLSKEQWERLQWARGVLDVTVSAGVVTPSTGTPNASWRFRVCPEPADFHPVLRVTEPRPPVFRSIPRKTIRIVYFGKIGFIR